MQTAATTRHSGYQLADQQFFTTLLTTERKLSSTGCKIYWNTVAMIIYHVFYFNTQVQGEKRKYNNYNKVRTNYIDIF